MPAGRNETQSWSNQNDVSTRRHKSPRLFFSAAAPPFRTNANYSTIAATKNILVHRNGQASWVQRKPSLLDCGAEANFITKSAATALGLKQERVYVETIGFIQQTTSIWQRWVHRHVMPHFKESGWECSRHVHKQGIVWNSDGSQAVRPEFKHSWKGRSFHRQHALMKQQVLKLKSGITWSTPILAGWLLDHWRKQHELAVSATSQPSVTSTTLWRNSTIWKIIRATRRFSLTKNAIVKKHSNRLISGLLEYCITYINSLNEQTKGKLHFLIIQTFRNYHRRVWMPSRGSNQCRENTPGWPAGGWFQTGNWTMRRGAGIWTWLHWKREEKMQDICLFKAWWLVP